MPPPRPQTRSTISGRAVRRRFGAAAKIDNIVSPTLGGSNRTVVFDRVEGAARRRLVSRQETYSAEDSPFLAPSDQFKVMAAAHRHGLPVPEPVFEYDEADSMGHGFVTAFVRGETMPKKIIGDPAFVQARSRLAGHLADFARGGPEDAVPLARSRVLGTGCGQHRPDPGAAGAVRFLRGGASGHRTRFALAGK